MSVSMPILLIIGALAIAGVLAVVWWKLGKDEKPGARPKSGGGPGDGGEGP